MEEAMRMLKGLALASGLAVAAAVVFPVMAQQGQPQAPMMGPGGMMGQGTGDEGKSGATGQGAGSPMGGMMGQGGMTGQGGMMGGMRSMMGDDKGGMMGGCAMMGGMGHGMRGMMMTSMPMTEAKLAYMKAELGITDAQASAWEDYAKAVRAQQAAMESMHGDMMKAMGGSALDRMDARIKAMEIMVDNLKALKPATTALYAVLTDAQKEKANQLLGGACGMM